MSVAAAKYPVLVIEDEPAVLSFVKAALERSGYGVVPVACGVEALEKLARERFLGVVSDMRTPGGVDGADVHDWIACHCPELLSRIIFITGDIVSEETAAALRRTGAPCVEKPFRVQQLIAMVEKVFGGPK